MERYKQLKLGFDLEPLMYSITHRSKQRYFDMKKLLTLSFLAIFSTLGFCQKETEVKEQDSISVAIDQMVKKMFEEQMDTLFLPGLKVSYDTLKLGSSPIENFRNSDSASVIILYNEKGVRMLVAEGTYYFFEHQKLIKTYALCGSGSYMGLCNGLFSEWSNYFVDNKLYKTIEGVGEGQCDCMDNIILDSESIQELLEIYYRKN